MAWTDMLWSLAGEVASSAASSMLEGGSSAPKASQSDLTKQALLQDTSRQRTAQSDYRTGLATAAAKGFVQPSPAAKQVSGGNAANILASLVTQDDIKAFYLAMSRDQQRAQQQGTRNPTA